MESDRPEGGGVLVRGASQREALCGGRDGECEEVESERARAGPRSTFSSVSNPRVFVCQKNTPPRAAPHHRSPALLNTHSLFMPIPIHVVEEDPARDRGERRVRRAAAGPPAWRVRGYASTDALHGASLADRLRAEVSV